MPYPPAHKRVTVFGTLLQPAGGGSEIFDFGWASKSTMGLQDLSAALLGVIQTAWTNPSNSISSVARLDGVRVESIDDAGKVTGSYASRGTRPVGAAAGASITILSHCITLETQAVNGHGGHVRGRFYPPAYLDVSGAIAIPSRISDYADNWAGLLSGCNNAGDVVSVASVTGGGQIATVTSVTVDNIIDTIRRRKNHVTGTRSGGSPVSS